MRLVKLSLALATSLAALALSGQARADLMFDFNDLSLNKTGSYAGFTYDYASPTAVLTSLQNAVTADHNLSGVTVSVSGATGYKGSYANGRAYDGEGYVVGERTSPYPYSLVPATLGTTDGCMLPSSGMCNNPSDPNLPKLNHFNDPDATANDGFLTTNSIFNGSPNNKIVITVTGLLITEMSFDLEIFPDSGGNPDFHLVVNGNTIDLPGDDSNHLLHGDAPKPTAGYYDYSPNHITNSSGGEYSRQLLTHFEDLTVPTNNNLNPQIASACTAADMSGCLYVFEFYDWPATIGIDNLSLGYPPPPQEIPEPGSLALFGIGLAGLGWARRSQKARA